MERVGHGKIAAHEPRGQVNGCVVRDPVLVVDHDEVGRAPYDEQGCDDAGPYEEQLAILELGEELPKVAQDRKIDPLVGGGEHPEQAENQNGGGSVEQAHTAREDAEQDPAAAFVADELQELCGGFSHISSICQPTGRLDREMCSNIGTGREGRRLSGDDPLLRRCAGSRDGWALQPFFEGRPVNGAVGTSVVGVVLSEDGYPSIRISILTQRRLGMKLHLSQKG